MAFPFILSKMFVSYKKNNTTLFSLIILYKVNYLDSLGYRERKISRLHRTAFLNVKYLFSKGSLSKKISLLKIMFTD